mgnify:FL=1
MSGTVERRSDDGRNRVRAADIAGPTAVFVLFIGFWYLVSGVLLPSHKRFLLPAPHTVVREGFLVWRQGDRRGLQPILVSLWDSSKVALTGLAITIVFGISLALLMSTRRWIEKAT